MIFGLLSIYASLIIDPEVAIRTIDGVLIGETSVEVGPVNLCSGVVDENINLEAVHHYFSDDAWEAVLGVGTIIHINKTLLQWFVVL